MHELITYYLRYSNYVNGFNIIRVYIYTLLVNNVILDNQAKSDVIK